MIKTTYPRPGALLTAGLLLCASFTTIARGDTFTQTVWDQDWNALMWGTPAAAPATGHSYVSATGGNNTFRISANGAASTFGGSSLTVSSGTRALMKNQNGAISTVNGDLTLSGGRLSHGPNGPASHAATLDVFNFIVNGSTASVIDPSSTVTTLTIDGTLTGTGDLTIRPENGTNARNVKITGINNYTGVLTVQSPIQFELGAGYTFTNTLTLQTTAKLNVTQSLTIEEGKLVANGVTIPAGTYTGAGLTGLGANFVNGGGTLTVTLKDTDADGLPDYFEDLIINTDTGDAVDDYDDIAGPNNAPATTDFDGDGRSDAAEYASGVLANQSSPVNPDTDGDGLLDGPEAAGTDNNNVSTGFGPTKPNLKDSDADGFDDSVELRYGFNPNDGNIIPGSAVTIVNGSFEEPVIAANVGAPFSGGTVPGWSVQENDFYVVRAFDFTDVVNPTGPKHGLQFATADRRAPNPDVEPTTFPQGIEASMGMKQDIDVSSFAAAIDAGDRTFILDYEFRDSDTADHAVITLQFLNGTGTDLGRSSTFTTPNGAADWVHKRQVGFPPVGTRTVRLTATVIKVQAGTSSIRNVHFDNFTARLVHFDFDNDDMPDDWELLYSLNPEDGSDAALTFEDDLTNLQEFQRGTNPNLPDTDGDGIDDDDEVTNGTDPTDPNSPGANPQVTNVIATKDGTGQITKFEVVVSGLVPGRTYTLFRGTDLITFPTTVDTHAATGATDTFTDLTPLPSGTSSKAFYRLQD
ncbi:hypothetical protein OKA05_22590 [Luteolibacter arcticus]|uniref:Uncharacterized protein n=1 Tax=Luteolibacter arcticus TaxID=1581411 RepID=A0ABT3GPB6_9BACT|nr:hypothetical protein [Luteolibacter arcticus]MCW1925366.1 hypothetical protein [Luteolibacter arcticus]